MFEHDAAFNERKRRKYGIVSNFLYYLREAKSKDKKLFYYQVLPVIPFGISSVIGTILPSEVVRGLEEQWQLSTLAGYIFLLAAVMWVSNLAVIYMRNYQFVMGRILQTHFGRKAFRKIMSMDYDLLEEPENQKLIGNTWRVLRTGYLYGSIVSKLPSLLSMGLVVLVYGFLIMQKSLILMVLLMGSVGASMWILSLIRKKHGQYHEELSRYSKEAAYITRQTMDSSAGKDIRIYRMMDWFLKKYDESLKSMDNIFERIHNWYHWGGIANSVMGFFTDSFAWGYLLYLLIQGQITIAEFVLYIGLTNSFSKEFEQVLRNVMELAPASVSISYLREFMELPNRWGESDDSGVSEKVLRENRVTLEQMESIRQAAVKLELRDVSYTYPGETKPTISHVNLVIQPGEKLALLGLNGAGKTTLVKLICGFYQPTEGEILLNGIPVRDFEREEYYSLFSVLFQDINMLPLTLDENLTGECTAAIDRKRLEKALQISGFYDKYNSLPKKGSTLLVREVNEGALDFSGGEKQKMFFARALYKQAPMLILDEPTAALDPIAENELYQKYGEATKGCTSIYISHRLSSTRFCDRIILLEHGRIIEEGTHESLMAGNTRYAQLFAIQSKYYKEQEKKRRLSDIMGDVYIEDTDEKEGIFHE